jgi:hypothetical protein
VSKELGISRVVLSSMELVSLSTLMITLLEASKRIVLMCIFLDSNFFIKILSYNNVIPPALFMLVKYK